MPPTASEKARPQTGTARERQVRALFSRIAPRYDLLNHLLSLNVDRRWRRDAVDALGWDRTPGGLYLDACAGTYDLALELARRPGFRGRVVASDFARPMLAEGRGKLEEAPVLPACGDALRLPFGEGIFHGATVAFGVRNLADLDRGLGELHRVIRPGGRLVVLDFTVPPNPLVRRLYLLYFERILPLVGRIVSGHPWAYRYLPESVKEFPGPEGLAERFENAGFRRVEWRYLTLGIAAIHVGQRS
ncbi:MAG: ubiquinone/menaquinone biosynthesis methyltransferase [Gemmatimonadetes bacterium]|nr:class I SAM-dependent methyltransferase [Gemmatimonadota bacterium]NIR77367.1 class I SAM-dependent methyltransferase [Gemmatimonadota bacterium]NIT88312.1 class I SAM-dependent methyltransferase [Gemmatimonadota bacterium]NIU32125.1 class I SAM-dependent methyltransferase [Gemmatimonadota bacterium]NIU34746.1 ubiquinone/menaquinone biosynthesis methyltransferase [Gemmatimonadota bacterium]